MFWVFRCGFNVSAGVSFLLPVHARCAGFFVPRNAVVR